MGPSWSSAAELVLRETSWPTLASLAALIWLALVITSYVTSYRRLRHIPGPPLAAWTSLWWIRASISKKGHLYLYEACKQYGPLVRIGPNMLVTTDTELVRKMNAVRSPYNRSEWNKAFRLDPGRDNLFSQTDRQKHARMRQKLTMGYSGKENSYLEPDMDKVILQLVHLIKAKYISRRGEARPVDLGQLLQYLTLDIITALALGKPFGWVENDEDMYEYVATMEKNAPAFNFLAAVPLFARLLGMPAVQRALLPTVKDKIGMGRVKFVAQQVIADRFVSTSEKRPRMDMTQSFIEDGLTQTEIADESLLQILAGSDTSGTIMRAAVIYITTNPRIFQRLRAEVVAAAVPNDQVISYARAQELPYLNACIKETLRYYPVNTGLSPKTVGPEGDEYKGLRIPPGTDIAVCAWMVYRHNPVYGPDAGVYRPERWLEADSTQLAAMEREHELVFMYGAYKCMGERIARIELAKTIFELFRRFDFAVLNPMKPLEKEHCYSIWVQRGLMVRIEERGAE